jgi:UDP-N-acetylmuramate dehydrogenase
MNAGGHGASTGEVLVAALVVDLTGWRGAGSTGRSASAGAPGAPGAPGALGAAGTPGEPGAAGAPDGGVDGAKGASWVPAGDLSLTYRRSSIADTDVVVEAEFALGQGDATACERRIAEIVTWRRDNQPGGQNAGSVFTNPPGDAAGRLVELAGLKGHRLGSAEVSTKHANFIQADAGGSANDVAALIVEVARVVEKRLGVRLSPEVRMIGFDGPSHEAREVGFDR